MMLRVGHAAIAALVLAMRKSPVSERSSYRAKAKRVFAGSPHPCCCSAPDSRPEFDVSGGLDSEPQ